MKQNTVDWAIKAGSALITAMGVVSFVSRALHIGLNGIIFEMIQSYRSFLLPIRTLLLSAMQISVPAWYLEFVTFSGVLTAITLRARSLAADREVRIPMSLSSSGKKQKFTWIDVSPDQPAAPASPQTQLMRQMFMAFLSVLLTLSLLGLALPVVYLLYWIAARRSFPLGKTPTSVEVMRRPTFARRLTYFYVHVSVIVAVVVVVLFVANYSLADAPKQYSTLPNCNDCLLHWGSAVHVR